MISDALRVAAVGVGRIGVFHARHVQEIGAEGVAAGSPARSWAGAASLAEGCCRLVAVADRHGDTARRVAAELSAAQDTEVLAFDSAEALAEAGVADAAVIASRTADHRRDTVALVEAGLRVLLEKPLADDLDEARAFAAWLDADGTRARAVMLAFQRRYDEALLRTKALLDEGIIGAPFKIVSVLEDPDPPPAGYQSPGLLTDMGVHNADEVLWLTGRAPTAATGAGARLHNQHIDGVTAEDFDDAFVHYWLGDDAVARIQVSRNHVAGYRNETTLYGPGGLIHVGHFDDDPLRVRLEAYGRAHEILEKRAFDLRDYDPGHGGRPVPVFIRRFGDAYKGEVADFVARCRAGQDFAVTQADGLRAMAMCAAGAGEFVQAKQKLRLD